MKSIKEARSDLLSVIPYIRYAINEAKENGKPILGIFCEFNYDAGKIVARFDTDFIEDIALIISAPKQTDEDNIKAKARQFTDQFSL